VPTVLLGALGGLVVGLTSVGSGSLIIVILLALYPALRPNDLVGTDLVQAVRWWRRPRSGTSSSATCTSTWPRRSCSVGARVLLGARLSSRAPAAVVRAALVVGAAGELAEALRAARRGGARGGRRGRGGAVAVLVRGRLAPRRIENGSAQRMGPGRDAVGGERQRRRHGVLERVRDGDAVPPA
jgi:hypothetical protein